MAENQWSPREKKELLSLKRPGWVRLEVHELKQSFACICYSIRLR
jgi:hypothetical protein